jgi:hypothetical protein
MINVRDLISQLRKVQDQNLLVVAYDARGVRLLAGHADNYSQCAANATMSYRRLMMTARTLLGL